MLRTDTIIKNFMTFLFVTIIINSQIKCIIIKCHYFNILLFIIFQYLLYFHNSSVVI